MTRNSQGKDESDNTTQNPKKPCIRNVNSAVNLGTPYHPFITHGHNTQPDTSDMQGVIPQTDSNSHAPLTHHASQG